MNYKEGKRLLEQKVEDFPSNKATNQIVATNQKIDALVCELYGLTKEEIGIVETSIGKLEKYSTPNGVAFFVFHML